MHVWLDRFVRYHASGKPERAYARWLVLHFVWSQVRGVIGHKPGRELFLRLAERSSYHEALTGLDRYVELVFQAASAFFKAKRGKGGAAKDASVFFKHANLHHQFQRYWRSGANRFRGRARKAIQKFQKDMSVLEEQ